MERLTVDLELQAPVEDIWAVLMDIERFSDYMSSVQWIRVLTAEGATRTAEWSVLLRGSVLRWTETATIDADAHRVDFVQVDGDLSVFQGAWTLEPLTPARTRAALSVEFEIGIPLLARMLNPIARESLQTNTVEMLRALEERSRLTTGPAR